MDLNEENPVNGMTAAKILGQSRTRISAIKHAMGITGRYFFLSDVRQWMRDNPNFTVAQVYPRKSPTAAR